MLRLGRANDCDAPPPPSPPRNIRLRALKTIKNYDNEIRREYSKLQNACSSAQNEMMT